MIVSVEEQNLFLACRFGAGKAAGASSADTLHLFAGDPLTGGTELTVGYTPPSITNNGTNWPAPALGELVCAAQTITSTAAFSDEATHWALKNVDTGDWGASGPLPEEVSVTAAGVVVTVQPVIYFASVRF